jgi:hypothetical protein
LLLSPGEDLLSACHAVAQNAGWSGFLQNPAGDCGSTGFGQKVLFLLLTSRTHTPRG